MKAGQSFLPGVFLALFSLLVSAGSASSSVLVPQTALPGACIPQFSVPLPVFGPAGSQPRVNARQHPFLNIDMKEARQQVLPQDLSVYPKDYFDIINQVQAACPQVNLQDTVIWAYETSDALTGKTLGPARWPAVTLETTRAVPTMVQYVNNLPPFNFSNQVGTTFSDGLVQGLITIDQTNLWSDPMKLACHARVPAVNCVLDPGDACCKPFVGPAPAVPHLHGAEVPPGFDGGPEAWFTPDGQKGPQYRTMGNPGAGKAVYLYNNSQEPGTLWFHEHNLGATRGGVYSSLAGFYLLRDPANEPKRLPSEQYEIELVVQDRQFDTNSQLFFPDGSGADVATSNLNGPPTNPDIHPFWNPEFIGDVAMVNGAPWPVMKVEPRRYRFRLLDASNARVFRLSFGALPVYQVVADAAYLDAPVPIQQVFLAPGERADIIVDFSQAAGQTVTVTNDAPVPFPDGLYPVPHPGVDAAGNPVMLPADQPQMASIMQFKVGRQARDRDFSCDPARGQCQRPKPVLRLTDGKGNLARGVKVDKVRQLILKEHGGAGGPIEVLLNNTNFDGMTLNQMSPNLPANGISEQPRVGSIEMWEVANLTGDAHPIHTHLVQFEILNRETFDVDGTMGSGIPGGYIGFDDGISPRIPGAWPKAFAAVQNSPLCFNIDPNPADDPFNPCPGFGPPLPYNTSRVVTLPNGDKAPAIGGNPDITPYLLHDSTAPPPEEAGLKDTAKFNPGQVTRIVMRFAPTSLPLTPHKSLAGMNFYPFDPTQGEYVWHCHILDHEDNDMMRPYKVVK